jgi:hypothetical protein
MELDSARWRRCLSSEGAVSGASSSVPETAGLVEEQQSRPALLLVVSSGHELPAG